jgi:diguanylate cyclase (GGDEF)-like protein/PAS domain S-box-containing protein
VAGSFERALLRSLALASDRARLLDRVSRAHQALEAEAGDRMRAEAELMREKERAQVTLHSIGDGVITTDTAGAIDYMNPSAERLTGWTMEEAKGQPLAQIYPLHDEATREPLGGLADTVRRLESTLQAREPQLLRRRDGEEFAVTQTVTPIRGPRGDALGSVLVFRDVTETRSLARRLAYQASHDTVTGLLNRREFEARLAHSLEVAHNEARQHICLYMDLDQFKLVNDTCGHAAGDDLLRQLALLVHSRLRESDALARLGGDEFGVLLEGCPLQQGVEIAEALRGTVRDYRFVWEDKTFEIGVSIGIVAVTGNCESVGSIMSAADVACYAAKDLGRNRIHVYQDTDLDLARRHGEMQWVSRITQALGENRLALFYQDIVAVQSETNLRHSVEILVRMRDERGELVPPGAFLPAAERYNLMPTIDRWVVHNCFRWLAAQPSLEGVLIGINLSGTTLSDDNFLPFIREQFERYRVPHETVCFEITETAAIANQAAASQFIRELRAMGCWFALDDFGSGLSSFAYLKNLPVDYLKIDGSFVRDMLHDPYDRAMVAAINEVGHRMGIRTIAEFVENPETLHALADLGVDYAQGWALGKPKPLLEATAAAFRLPLQQASA